MNEKELNLLLRQKKNIETVQKCSVFNREYLKCLNLFLFKL